MYYYKYLKYKTKYLNYKNNITQLIKIDTDISKNNLLKD